MRKMGKAPTIERRFLVSSVARDCEKERRRRPVGGPGLAFACERLGKSRANTQI